MTAFDKLARPVQRWIRDQGWQELRDIQARSVHAVMDGSHDLIISASTAGGKTEAAFLPLISQAVDQEEAERKAGFNILYVGPLKALINDQTRRLEEICEKAGLQVVPWHGDVSSSVKARAQKDPRGILLITPESLEAIFVTKGTLVPKLFSRLNAIVIDELHTLLDSERGVQLRSLFTRMEIATGTRVRRIGLSATLGDMELARSFLRPGAPDEVTPIVGEESEAELKLQLRGYVAGGKDESPDPSVQAISRHLFEKLRGSDNLVFAGARNRVEVFADRLSTMCREANLPQEFYPHHASLSRDHREFVEKRLKDARLPTTAICTSTLELGIDIGDVACVAQIGAPFTVASLRQRMGRSGRRAGQPAVLRQYAIEADLLSSSAFSDRLRLGLVRSIAMIELLLERWCEAPKSKALHLSTLVHQILSVIAERGGASAKRLYATLCEKGPFHNVSQEMFLQVLRRLGDPEVGLIEQSSDGLLLLGGKGERLVEHYSFYAVFMSPEEYRVVADGKELGTLPVDNMLAPGMTIIFSGRRWEVVELHDQEKVLMVKPSRQGVAPVFGGDAGEIDDRVIEKMFEILEGETVPVYLDQQARQLLAEARSTFEWLIEVADGIIPLGERTTLLATRCGSVKNATLALALRNFGFQVQTYDGFLEVLQDKAELSVPEALREISEAEEIDLFSTDVSLTFEKFHPYLSTQLLQQDALSRRLDLEGAKALASWLVQ
ncbi:hypothetical protein Q669_21535 [Labrenzia sp. C1B10]|uniref:DEAD/DEAH box helicase n=1 Tax=unclassified Labrenzia TaxID=2648686 RepID=UPI0003B83B96|nr:MULTISPECIES: DEAD/DEAH box helicase [unclassified Labrenzia]ERP97791.1 hypothetical protein Q669_21535 [Labrenzia sp. C1B10]ERS01583.1 hypothetical protein Q675_05650 [Labrenzia sp. C1B70]